MSPTQQKALAILEKGANFTVTDVDVPTLEPGQILIKIQSVALNPADWKIPEYGLFIDTYPTVLGYDIAGVVEELGDGVTKFKKGDRVCNPAALNIPTYRPNSNYGPGTVNNSHAGFQQYATVFADYTAEIPPSLSFDQAASLPLGLGSATTGLYSDALGAGYTAPWVEGGIGKYSGKPIVVLGGSGSVGSFAIQLAKLSGFSPIITTASTKSEAYLKSLGATHIIDRHIDLSAISEKVKTITSTPIDIVFDAVSTPELQNAGYNLLSSGGKLVLVLPSALGDRNEDGKRVISTNGSPYIPSHKDLFVGLYGKLNSYLVEGLIKPSNVEVVPGGLKGIIGGLEKLKQGVSAVKLIGHPQD